MDEVVKRFLAVDSAAVYGYIDGFGCLGGDGTGKGYVGGAGDLDGGGYGCSVNDDSGAGCCNGEGEGAGNGSGAGTIKGEGYSNQWGVEKGGIKAINGRKVFIIDGVETVIDSVHQVRGIYYAKGAIIGGDLSLRPVFIARVGNFFAHGYTLRGAVRVAREKWMDNRPLEDKLDEFVKAHPDPDKEYSDLFDWHHTLTGSCEAGRREWCRAHGYEPTDSITIRTFIEQTRNDYGGEAIRELAQRYNIKFD